MIAIDTNLIVRLTTRDEPTQAARARSLIDREQIFVSKTVLLESEWVLRSAYGFESGAIADTLRALLGLANVSVEDPPCVSHALEWLAQGLDFADALHLASIGTASHFATFDRSLMRQAKSLTGLPDVIAP